MTGSSVRLLAFFALLACAPQPVAARACPDAPASPAAAGTPEVRDRECFTVSSVGESGLEASDVDGFLAKAKEQRSTSLLLVVDGAVVVEEYFGTDPQRATIAMSMTKSVVALAAGLLVDDGHLELDRPLSETILPEWKDGDKASISLRHLLSQTSGLGTKRYGEVDNDWTGGSIERHGLDSKLDTPPGEAWNYNNNMIDFMSVVLQRANPEHLYLDDFLQARLFGKMGMQGVFWLKDGRGQPRGAGELLMRPIDLAKIGQLVLDRGVWRGEQLVSEAWIEQMLRPVDGAEFYGLLWWLDGDREGVLGYRAAGYLGQFVVIVPDSRLVAVRTRDPREVGDDPKEYGWYDFGWDVLALAGHDVAKADRNGFATPMPR